MNTDKPRRDLDAGESVKICGNLNLISLVRLGTVDYATGLRLQQQLVALRKEEKIGDVLLLLEHRLLSRSAAMRKLRMLSPRPNSSPSAALSFSSATAAATSLSTARPDRRLSDLRPARICPAPTANENARSSRIRPPPGRSPDPYLRRLRDPDKASAGPNRRVDGQQLHCHSERKRTIRRIVLWSRGTCCLPDAASERLRRSQTRRHRHPHLPLRHLPRLRPQRKHRSQLFNLIIPCGITAKPVTSMQQELGKPLDMNAVAESISRNFGTVFSTQMLWVETLDALLGNTVGVPIEAACRTPPAPKKKEDDTAWA